jgi:hypothetical protein
VERIKKEKGFRASCPFSATISTGGAYLLERSKIVSSDNRNKCWQKEVIIEKEEEFVDEANDYLENCS